MSTAPRFDMNILFWPVADGSVNGAVWCGMVRRWYLGTFDSVCEVVTRSAATMEYLELTGESEGGYGLWTEVRNNVHNPYAIHTVGMPALSHWKDEVGGWVPAPCLPHTHCHRHCHCHSHCLFLSAGMVQLYTTYAPGGDAPFPTMMRALSSLTTLNLRYMSGACVSPLATCPYRYKC